MPRILFDVPPIQRSIHAERDNELRAAMLSLYIHAHSTRSYGSATDSWPSLRAFLLALPGGLQPMPVTTAARVVKYAEGPEGKRAQRICASLQAIRAQEALMQDDKSSFFRHMALAFETTSLDLRDLQAFMLKQHKPGSSYQPINVAGYIYERLKRATKPEHWTVKKPPYDAKVLVNPESFVATTEISTTLPESTRPRDSRVWAQYVDPRSWRCIAPAFWLASDRVWLNDEGDFVSAPPSGQPPDVPLGESWEGYLFEFAVFNVNKATLCGYQVILRVQFENMRPPALDVRMRFSLYACCGGLQLGMITSGGIEVDSGHEWVRQERPGGDVLMSVKKSLRYADMLTRRTMQGHLGAGQLTNMMAPLAVGFWMYCLTLEMAFGGSPVCKPGSSDPEDLAENL